MRTDTTDVTEESPASTDTAITATTIVVGVDGSPQSRRALEWCARYAHALGAVDVVVVHAVHLPDHTPFAEFGPILSLPVMNWCERDRIRALLTNEWCRPLREADVEHRIVVLEGPAAVVLRQVVAHEHADLLVTGHGGLSEMTALVIGSTTEQLAAHLGCPLLIIP